MRHRSLRIAVVLFFLTAAGSLFALAENWVKAMVADIPFSFAAGEKSFAKGSYRVELQSLRPAVLVLRLGKGGEGTSLPVITRLAREDHSAHATETNLVFDTVGDQKFLSEVWLPRLDGFLVRGTPEEHQHTVVKGKM